MGRQKAKLCKIKKAEKQDNLYRLWQDGERKREVQKNSRTSGKMQTKKQKCAGKILEVKDK